jgi:hypothetical protein
MPCHSRALICLGCLAMRIRECLPAVMAEF